MSPRWDMALSWLCALALVGVLSLAVLIAGWIGFAVVGLAFIGWTIWEAGR